MRAAVCVRPGGPEVLEIRELPVPAVREGWSLVQVKGAGLNRSELRTRQGHSPNVTFPRVLGIECTGIVAASTDPMVPDGTTVAAVMGEMGREFDGGYAEYALAAELAADAGHHHVAVGHLGRATRDVPDCAGLAGRAGGRAGWPGAVADPWRDLVGGDGGRVDRVRLRRRDRGHDPAARQDRRVDCGWRRLRPRRRRRVAGGERARDLARGPGLCSGSRRGEHGSGLAAPGPPGRDGVHGGLAQRVGDPGLRTDSDDPVRNQAHGLPQRHPQGQRGHDRVAAGRPRGRGRPLPTERRPYLRPGRHRCGPPVHGEQPSHRQACHDAR